MLRKLSTVTIFMFLMPVAMAGQTLCVGDIPRYYVTTSGILAIQPTFHPSYVQLCGLDSEWKGVPAESCKAWFATILAAYHANTTIRISYDATDVSAGGCASIVDYGGSPAPRYVMALPKN